MIGRVHAAVVVVYWRGRLMYERREGGGAREKDPF